MNWISTLLNRDCGLSSVIPTTINIHQQYCPMNACLSEKGSGLLIDRWRLPIRFYMREHLTWQNTLHEKTFKRLSKIFLKRKEAKIQNDQSKFKKCTSAIWCQKYKYPACNPQGGIPLWSQHPESRSLCYNEAVILKIESMADTKKWLFTICPGGSMNLQVRLAVTVHSPLHHLYSNTSYSKPVCFNLRIHTSVSTFQFL